MGYKAEEDREPNAKDEKTEQRFRGLKLKVERVREAENDEKGTDE